MQKKLIALAIAGLSGAAFAQSNVTVYGVADVTLEQAKADGSTTTGQSRGSFTRVNSNSSLIGFKGAESLGNGMTAVFQFESGINVDSGATAAFTGTNLRDTFVGIAGGFGTVAAGNLTGPTRALGAGLDLNAGATGPGANSSILGKPVGGAGSGVLDTRLTNAIAYITPNFSGFSAVIGYQAGENRSLDGATDATKINLGAWDIGLNYANGPLFVGYAHASVNAGTTDTSGTLVNTVSSANNAAGTSGALKTWKNDRLGASYAFGEGNKIVAVWDSAKLDLAGSTQAKRTTWGLGGKFAVSANGGLIAQYYKANKLRINGADVADSGSRLFELGYEHSLSKRTMLKASWTRMTNDAAAAYDFNVGAVSAAGANSAMGNVGAGADPQVLAVGIRHTF